MINMLDLSAIKRVKTARHLRLKINQLYHPTGSIPQDSQGLVYSYETINITKFAPILIKEWFYLLKKGGYLIIDYKPNNICDFQKLEKNLWWLWKNQYEILYHGPIDAKNVNNLNEKKLRNFISRKGEYHKVPKTKDICLRFICKKIKSTKIAGDAIDKWSFGIITNGKRNSWVELIIKSIQQQKIPNYEIIVCGNYFDRREKDFIYLPFHERDDKGWITKKKNLIAKKAKYENLMIIHDRVVLGTNWYKGMKQWGNCFEHLACVQLYNNKRATDWLLHEKLEGLEFGFASMLDYRDWDFDIYQGGQMHILKKNCWKNVLWDENRYWDCLEDVDISNRLRDAGYILRFNPDAKVKLLNYIYGQLPEVEYNQLKLSKNRSGNSLRILSRFIYSILYKISPIRSLIQKYFSGFFIVKRTITVDSKI